MYLFCLKSILIFILFISGVLFASGSEENPLAITVKEKKEAEHESPAPSSTITTAEMERMQVVSAADALATLPGVHVSRAGGPGNFSSIFARGLLSSHVLVVVDGMPLMSSLRSGTGYDLGSIPSENISRIEFMRGSYPVKYGSSAVGGVVIINTKKGFGTPAFFLSSETGVLDMPENNFIPNSVRASAHGRGSYGDTDYSIRANFHVTEGISDADFAPGAEPEKSIYGKLEKDGMIYGNAGYSFSAPVSDTGNFYVTGFFRSRKKEIDDGPGPARDDPNRIIKRDEFFIRPSIKEKFFNEKWESTLAFSIFHDLLVDRDPPDKRKVYSYMKNEFSSSRLQTIWDNKVAVSSCLTVNTGLTFIREWGTLRYYDTTFFSNKFFSPNNLMQQQFEIYVFPQMTFMKRLHIEGGVRTSFIFPESTASEKEHEETQSSENFHTEPLFSVGSRFDTSFQSSVSVRFSRGYNVPTLFQRYSPFADPFSKLSPETVYSADAGFTQYLYEKKIRLDINWFRNSMHNMIDLNKQQIYTNRYRVISEGFEFSAATRPFYGFSLKGNYTWLYKLKESALVNYKGKTYKTDTEVLRRPEHTANLSFNYSFLKKFNLNWRLRYVGKRMDRIINYPATPYIESVNAFILMDAAFQWEINSFFTLTARIENITNTEYSYITEYGTPGISPYIGLKARF